MPLTSFQRIIAGRIQDGFASGSKIAIGPNSGQGAVGRRALGFFHLRRGLATIVEHRAMAAMDVNSTESAYMRRAEHS
jgi:hypothetical protein